MYFRAKKKTARELYLGDSIDEDKDGNSLTWGDVLPDSSCLLEEVDLRLEAQQLHSAMARRLEPREQEILRLRYGLGGAAPLTQREVAAQLGISRSYVSRIEKKALERLRVEMEHKG